MNALTGRPNEYTMGYDFNYNLWTANTVITLGQVPWDMNYRDVVRFERGHEDLNQYITRNGSEHIKIEKVSFHRPNTPIKLEVANGVADRYNYLRASNPAQPIDGDVPRDYYYFIRETIHESPGSTMFVLQLDLFQTYGYTLEIEQGYVEQGHIGIANGRHFDSFGREYLTVPEGLNIGSEYQIHATHSKPIIDLDDESTYDILVISTIDLTSDAGTVQDPKIKTATGGQMHGLPSGASQYIFDTLDAFYVFMLNKSIEPWVTQGIISISLIPSLERYGYETTPVTIPGTTAQVQGKVSVPKKSTGRERVVQLKNNWREEVRQSLPPRYRHLYKFLTFPYLAVEATTYSGTPIILKPEAWNDANMTFLERASLLPPAQRVMLYPHNYNSKQNRSLVGESHRASNAEGVTKDSEYLDLFTQIGGFPTFAIVNNGAIGYMASNAHSLTYQHSQADWSQDLARRGAQTGYDQATGAMGAAGAQSELGMRTDQALTNQSNTYMGEQTNLNNTFGIINGVGQGAMAGGALGGPGGMVGGALGGAATSGLSALQANMSTANAQNNARSGLGIRNSSAASGNAIAQGQMGMVRDSNYEMANYAAMGNYQQAIAGIKAKVQDAQLTQPSVSGQAGGEQMNLVHMSFEIAARIKMIDPAALASVGEYWLRYGYAVQRWTRNIPKDFMVMSKFTYWKLAETYITNARMPEGHKMGFRGMFEKGITVWRNPNDIGRIDIANNSPLGDIEI